MQLGRAWAVVLLVLVATAAVTEAKKGKGRGKNRRKFGSRGIIKNFKSEASRAYYNHNGVSTLDDCCGRSVLIGLTHYNVW
ncbi:hypothetical protein E2C01_093593 [Portunus trituberculatus]|uniref:Uncharacterized protein n=1 Tax=Portunus trituberculatus TaxID=210409 RepID=A0A5B7K0V6_PORTR|nr:hypothetical protein [Portunus trituberculatus]